MSIPTTEPASFVAGDTVTWSKSLSDYPATTWSLKYRFVNSAGKVDITAAADGSDYLVTLTAATTAAYTAGKYDFTGWVEKGTGPTAERVTVSTGRIEIKPNLAIQNTFDGRSTARKILETLETAYTSAVSSRAFVQEYEIAGRRMKFNSPGDWIRELNFWRSQVKAEERAERIADGLGGNARIMVRF
jgi:hypothetical protein